MPTRNCVLYKPMEVGNKSTLYMKTLLAEKILYHWVIIFHTAAIWHRSLLHEIQAKNIVFEHFLENNEIFAR